MSTKTLIGSCLEITARIPVRSSPFRISPVSIHDAEQLAVNYLNAYPPGVAGANIEDACNEMQTTFAGDYGELLVNASLGACQGDQLVGAILVVQRSPWDPDLACPFVIDFFVDPPSKNKGIGRALFRSSAAACLAVGHSQLALRTGEGTSSYANRIYSSSGMVELR